MNKQSGTALALVLAAPIAIAVVMGFSDPGGKPLPSCEAVDWDFEPAGEPSEFDFDVMARGQGQELIDAGGIVAWQDKWYCSHEWSEGWRFLGLEPGDIVHVDGMDVEIGGRAYFKRHETMTAVRDVLGTDKVLFQTCLPHREEIVVYYGTDIGQAAPGHPDPDIAADAM